MNEGFIVSFERGFAVRFKDGVAEMPPVCLARIYEQPSTDKKWPREKQKPLLSLMAEDSEGFEQLIDKVRTWFIAGCPLPASERRTKTVQP